MSVTDRWHTLADDGTPVPTPDHGRGSRWEVRYRDAFGTRTSRRFDDEDQAREFDADQAAAWRPPRFEPDLHARSA